MQKEYHINSQEKELVNALTGYVSEFVGLSEGLIVGLIDGPTVKEVPCVDVTVDVHVVLESVIGLEGLLVVESANEGDVVFSVGRNVGTVGAKVGLPVKERICWHPPKASDDLGMESSPPNSHPN